jgi:hypothetical protein
MLLLLFASMIFALLTSLAINNARAAPQGIMRHHAWTTTTASTCAFLMT